MEEWDSSYFLGPQNDDRPASLPVISIHNHKKTISHQNQEMF